MIDGHICEAMAVELSMLLLCEVKHEKHYCHCNVDKYTVVIVLSKFSNVPDQFVIDHDKENENNQIFQAHHTSICSKELVSIKDKLGSRLQRGIIALPYIQ